MTLILNRKKITKNGALDIFNIRIYKAFLNTTLFIVLLTISNVANAQNVNELETLKNEFKLVEKKRVFKEAKNNKNELQFTFSMLFLFYKKFISSQDNSRCNFTPSCSEYALQSIKKYGLFKGGLNAMDRLSRCNGLAPEQYDVDENQHLLIDQP